MKQTVLIADDDPDIVEILTRRCREAGLQVVTANDAPSALCQAFTALPDIAIVDFDMPGGNGFHVCELMASSPILHGIPIVILTASASPSVVRQCHEHCAYFVKKCNDVWSRVRPLLAELLQNTELENLTMNEQQKPGIDSNKSKLQSELMDTVFEFLAVGNLSCLPAAELTPSETKNSRPWILSIEDDDDIAEGLRIQVEQWGYDFVRACEGTAGYRKAFVEGPSAILLDYELPEGNGDYVLRRLKESTATNHIPVIVVTGRRERNIEHQMRSLGAFEFITKPFDTHKLRQALEQCVESKVESEAGVVA